MGKTKKNILKGTTLIEALTVLFIFSLITMAFYSTWTVATNYILLAKAQLTASALANEKLEIIRNLSFEDIVHTGMDSNAMLLQDEYLARGGREFHIFTQIKNQDDDFDGQCLATGDPDCPAPVDYKDVKITISWDNGKYSISNSSRFVPAGIEQPDPTKGILVINVLSDKDSMAPVSGANIRLERTDISYVDNQSTDANGRSVISGLSQATKKYKATLTKSGYETVSTELPFSEGGIYDPPTFEHSSVVALSVNQLVMYQNRLADFIIKTQDYAGNDLPNINYHISGGRELGKTSGLPVYTLDSHDDSGADAEESYEDQSPGDFQFNPEETGWRMIGASRENPFKVIPGENSTITVKLASESSMGILFLIEDIDSGSALGGVSVHMTSAGGYDATVTGDENGLVFFPKEETVPLISGETYDYTVTLDGFSQETGQISAQDGLLKQENISLTAS